MAVVSSGVFDQVILMIRLGRIKRTGGNDLGHDIFFPFSRPLDFLLHLEGRLPLFLAVIKDRGTILGAPVISLAVFRGGVMKAEKIMKESLIRKYGGVKNNLNGLRMARVSLAHILVSRAGEVPSRVTHGGVEHSRNFPKDL